MTVLPAPFGPIPVNPRPHEVATVTRKCDCGRPITADPLDMLPGVQEHNATPEHQGWGARQEAEDQREGAA